MMPFNGKLLHVGCSLPLYSTACLHADARTAQVVRGLACTLPDWGTPVYHSWHS